jgi:KipI family sensor histidine kinase inhibitor
MSPIAVDWLGDRALLLRFGETIDRDVNVRVHFAAQALCDARVRGVTEIVPAYASLCVHYDPAMLSTPGEAARNILIAHLLDAIGEDGAHARPATVDSVELAAVEVPVCYGGDFGPDLADVAAHANLATAEVVAMHAAAEYQVAMLGFAPGFPYLLGLDQGLHTPRRAQPRTRVPAGAVAIGGAQTGIYPRELPGGWQIIGRTPLALFDTARASPALFAPGQRVRFRAIDAQTFAAMSR